MWKSSHNYLDKPSAVSQNRLVYWVVLPTTKQMLLKSKRLCWSQSEPTTEANRDSLFSAQTAQIKSYCHRDPRINLPHTQMFCFGVSNTFLTFLSEAAVVWWSLTLHESCDLFYLTWISFPSEKISSAGVKIRLETGRRRLQQTWEGFEASVAPLWLLWERDCYFKKYNNSGTFFCVKTRQCKDIANISWGKEWDGCGWRGSYG